MVKEIDIKEIKKFIKFGDELYKGDKNYVPFINSDLCKTIKRLVFVKKRYFAVAHYDSNNNIDGRILLTISSSKQLNTDKCGYFSHIEFVQDYKVFKELMDYSIKILKEKDAKYICGSFFHHDPDNRRGILIDNFDTFPMLFTSYNKKYYKEYFEKYGFDKLVDALEYEYTFDKEKMNIIKEKGEKALIENDIHIDKVNFKYLDREIEDVHTIMEIASTSINFENVLSKEEIKKIFNSFKSFINPDFVFIARKNSDNSPIGFTMCLPNFNEVIKKMNGKMDLFGLIKYLIYRKKITSLRAMLQYIIPDYQHKGISKALYNETRKSVEKYNIKRIGLGTIMENNEKSNGLVVSSGGKRSKTYRIYYKELSC